MTGDFRSRTVHPTFRTPGFCGTQPIWLPADLVRPQRVILRRIRYTPFAGLRALLGSFSSLINGFVGVFSGLNYRLHHCLFLCLAILYTSHLCSLRALTILPVMT